MPFLRRELTQRRAHSSSRIRHLCRTPCFRAQVYTQRPPLAAPSQVSWLSQVGWLETGSESATTPTRYDKKQMRFLSSHDGQLGRTNRSHRCSLPVRVDDGAMGWRIRDPRPRRYGYRRPVDEPLLEVDTDTTREMSLTRHRYGRMETIGGTDAALFRHVGTLS